MSRAAPPAARTVLVAGIGNLFLGDDGFGVEVARRLSTRALPPGVTVEDFGIRGVDLAYALEAYDAVVLVDAVPPKDGPGTLHVLDASTLEAGPEGVEPHGMDPRKVLAFARTIGRMPDKVWVLGCEPSVLPDPEGDEIVVGLSAPVLAAIDPAVEQVEALVQRLQAVDDV